MKKIVGLRRIAISAAVVTALLSMNVFAEGSKENLPLATSPVAEQPSEDQAVLSNYQLVNGTISAIEKTEESVRIDIDNDTMGMVFHVAGNVFLLDQEGNYSTLEDLKEGMEITAIIPANAPVTMSIPPMTSGAIGFVIIGEGTNIDLSSYNDELVNAQNTLQLNVDEKVSIVDVKGSKMKYAEEDLKNKELLVLYGPSTRSIPAQTTPMLVMIMDQDEEMAVPEEEQTPAEAAPIEVNATETKAVCSIREEAVANGFTVNWTSNAEPVILEKDDVRVEVKLNSNEYKVNGETKFLKEQVRLSDGSMITGGDFGVVLAELTTADAE